MGRDERFFRVEAGAQYRGRVAGAIYVANPWANMNPKLVFLLGITFLQSVFLCSCSLTRLAINYCGLLFSGLFHAVFKLLENPANRLRIVSVTGSEPCSFFQEPATLIEANGLNSDTRLCGQLSDSHVPTFPPGLQYCTST